MVRDNEIKATEILYEKAVIEARIIDDVLSKIKCPTKVEELMKIAFTAGQNAGQNAGKAVAKQMAREKLEQSVDLWMETHQRNNASWSTQDFIDFVTESF